MKVAIHHNADSFSENWIQYCKEKAIDYKIVNCYANDIIQQLKDCEALLWHYHHANYRDVLFAKQLMASLQQSGKKVFPDHNTAWYFDDKVGQKYLLESINAPLVPSYVFYDKEHAVHWAMTTTYPKVFKLRGGAGSSNVQLIRSKSDCLKLIKRAFGTGFKQYDGYHGLIERINKYRSGKGSIKSVGGGIIRWIKPKEFEKMAGKEKGYFYAQDFIPHNQFDIRVIVIGGKAFAIKRMVRKNDFRASGSGAVLYEKEHFDDNTLKLAFQIATKIGSQCSAFDFVYNDRSDPLIVEISYGFTRTVYDNCVGYWDDELNFFEEQFNPYGWMIDNMLKQ